MVILMMGPQGSGKGTVGRKLSSHLDLPILEVGKLLRDLPTDDYRYSTINEAMKRGELAPVDKVASILKDRIKEAGYANGFILDGWCRQLEDIKEFDPQPDIVLVLDIPRETSIERITGRRICTSDGKVYNINTLPRELLDECEGELVQREDDTERAVNRRLNDYYSLTKKVLDLYKDKGILKVVDASGLPEEVFRNALFALEGI